MLGSQEVDTATRAALIMSWLRSQGKKAAVILTVAIINKPRLRDKEEIIDSIEQATADLELVR
jgi:MinD-like ATPase involved in chromosome partitioning or flagellar assembly